jgi:hypothetical protein
VIEVKLLLESEVLVEVEKPVVVASVGKTLGTED